MSIFISNFLVTGDCSNTSSGAVYFEISGDTPPFAVDCISSGCPLPASASTVVYEYYGLSADTYFLQIIDGGSNSTILSVYISSGTSAYLDASSTTCGLDNGSITANTNGAYGIVTFEVYDIDGNFVTSAETPNNYYDFQSLSANTYYVVANDGGGCTGITSTAIISSSSTFNFGAYVVDDGSCINGPSGKIYITGLTYPVSAYTITWSGNISGQTGTTVTGLTAGSYVVEITDPNNCSAINTFTVETVDPLSSVGFITLQQPSCFASDGEVEFIISGGTAPYFFSASTGEVQITFDLSAVFSNLAAGVYEFFVTDAGLCTVWDNVGLITPNSFTNIQINTTPSTCSTNSGVVQVIVDGGIVVNPSLQISITGSSGSQQIGTLGNPNQFFYGLENDTYIVEVNTPGCVYTATTTLESVNTYTFTAITSGTTCGSSNGSIEIIVSTGGTLPYLYTLTGPSSNPNTVTSPINTFTNLQSGDYIITINDSSAQPCYQQLVVNISNSSGVYFNTVASQPVDGSDGIITTYVTRGVPPFSYLWSGGSADSQTTSSVSGLTAGTYSVKVTDSAGCTTQKKQTLIGTTRYSSYRYYNICENEFRNSGLLTKRTMRSMYLEGFYDLTSGDTNCIINNANFSIFAQVGGQSAQTEFYTSSGATDYPSDTLWAQTITEILDNFVGISGTTVDVLNNRIKITTTCEELPKNCDLEPINPLQDTQVIVNLIIDYDISCEFCSPTPTPTPTTTLTLTPTPTTTLTPTPTLTPTESQTIFTWVSGANWYGDSGTACLNYNSFAIQWSLPTITPTISTFLVYIPTGLPITGEANNWIAISPSSSPGSIIYAVQVDVYGEIIDVFLCP